MKAAGGAVASLAFAYLVYGPLGFGARYTDHLQREARVALDSQGLSQVVVHVAQQPFAARAVLLSGAVTPTLRREAHRTVAALPGVATVAWLPATAGRSD